MAKKASSTSPSVPLHEVLEKEFAVLHGKLPPDYPISSTDHDERLKAFWVAVHALPEKRAALCLSGGGIRSATFGLGILQGLARCGLLEKFHYLSTVSGGGYIGSWLSAWIKHHQGGIGGVIDDLKRPADSTLHAEPESIRELREFSNYLTPKTGLFVGGFLDADHHVHPQYVPELAGANLMARSRDDDPQTVSGVDQRGTELEQLDGSPSALLGHRPDDRARDRIRTDRRRDGLCNRRCSFHGQCAVLAATIPVVSPTSVAPCVFDFGGMVGCVPQRSW